MSNIYIQEPPTSGKVLLHTTVGDIDVELWCKEAPKACRNFIQLCMEGYYNGTIFHRVVKGFIVQGGDPESTGFGGESVYGEPFKNEIHSRLRFVRRGLVAMANSGKEDNGSQFFFTLGACPELQNKHTIFGKVTGNTLYNMLKLEESLVDGDDRPIYPHKILSCKILDNPLTDIVPRILQKEKHVSQEKVQKKVKKNYSLLSFGEEAEEDEAEVDAVAKEFRGKSKSSHDLSKDPNLSSVPAFVAEDTVSSPPSDTALLESVRTKLKKEHEANKTIQAPSDQEEELTSLNIKHSSDMEKWKEIRKEIRQLKKEFKRKRPHEESEEKITDEDLDDKKKDENPLFAEYNRQIEKYTYKKTLIPSKGEEREKQTMQLLAKFQNKLQSANEVGSKETKSTDSVEDQHDSGMMAFSEDDYNDTEWLSHKLYFEDEESVVKDANMPSAEHYDITDPRNPMTQRRRHNDQKPTKNKRE